MNLFFGFLLLVAGGAVALVLMHCLVKKSIAKKIISFIIAAILSLTAWFKSFYFLLFLIRGIPEPWVGFFVIAGLVPVFYVCIVVFRVAYREMYNYVWDKSGAPELDHLFSRKIKDFEVEEW